jgi:hypothetical protein
MPVVYMCWCVSLGYGEWGVATEKYDNLSLGGTQFEPKTR